MCSLIAAGFGAFRPRGAALAAATHMTAIKAMLDRHKISDPKLELGDLPRLVAGADVFSRQSDGTTIAAQYAKHGISLQCAHTDRMNGWAEVMQGLGEPDSGLAAGCVRPR